MRKPLQPGTETAPPAVAAPRESLHPGLHEAIEEAVRSIRYGTVQIVIQDGRVVQIDKTEKIRLT